MLKTWGGAGEAGWGDGSRGATRPAQAGGVHVRRQAAHRAGDAFTSQSHAPSRTCHAVPTLVVAKVSLPRRWMAKGTSSTTCPKARNGSNRAIPMQFLCSSHGDEKCRSKTRRLGPCAPAYQAPGPRGRLHSTPIPRPGGGVRPWWAASSMTRSPRPARLEQGSYSGPRRQRVITTLQGSAAHYEHRHTPIANSTKMAQPLRPFGLERYLAPREFKAKHALCCSDAESWSMSEIMDQADDDSKAR